MINTRTILGGKENKPGDTEYFLSVRTADGKGYIYHEWYSLSALLKLKGCVLHKEGLLSRIRSVNPVFKELAPCVFHVKLTNSNKTVMRITKEKRLIKLRNKTFYEKDIFSELHKLWPAGSLHKQAKIMGSIPCKQCLKNI